MFLNLLISLRMENRLEGRRGTASSSRRESKSLCRLIIRAYGLTRRSSRDKYSPILCSLARTLSGNCALLELSCPYFFLRFCSICLRESRQQFPETPGIHELATCTDLFQFSWICSDATGTR